jgi:hypothetical protein
LEDAQGPNEEGKLHRIQLLEKDIVVHQARILELESECMVLKGLEDENRQLASKVETLAANSNASTAGDYDPQITRVLHFKQRY